jgi:hypothetical protein
LAAWVYGGQTALTSDAALEAQDRPALWHDIHGQQNTMTLTSKVRTKGGSSVCGNTACVMYMEVTS